MRKIFSFVWEIAKIAIVAALIVAPIRYFVFQPFFVKGASMEPNFNNGDYLIVDELSYRLRAPQRGEVIVFKPPNDLSQRYIKRIIGLPGEIVEIKDEKIDIIDKSGSQILLDESKYLPLSDKTLGDIKVVLGSGEYFVMGDNRAASFDSRSFGLLLKKNIIGKTALRVWPFAALAKY